jgi:hypothetical protein
MDYYNTTNSKGLELKERRAKAKSQKEVIKRLYSSYEEGLSPGDVYDLVDRKWPITSIRRAITNLTKEGYLIKTERTASGIYGREEHVWSKAIPMCVEYKQAKLFN